MQQKKIDSKRPIGGRFKLKLMSLLLVVSPVMAETVSFNQAISLSLQKHPQLDVYQFQRQAVEASAEQAATATPMSINVSTEDMFGTGSYSGVSGLQTQISLSWVLEDELLRARKQAAASKAFVVNIDERIKRVNIAADTASIYVRILTQKEELKLAKLAEHQAKQSLKKIEQRVSAGRTSVIDKYRSQADLAEKSLVVEDLIHEIRASKAELSAQWGEISDDFSVSGDLSQTPELKDISIVYNELTQSPLFTQYTKQNQLLNARIEQAKAEEQPSWQVSAGFKRNETVDDMGFTAGITIPFGAEGRNQGLIKSLNAEKLGQDSEAQIWLLKAKTQTLLLLHKLKHNQHVVEGLLGELIPALEKANIEAEKAYLTGNYSYADWYAVQQQLLKGQTDLIQAYANINQLNIELERYTGSAIKL